MQEEVIKEFFDRFNSEVRIVDLMLKIDKQPQTNNGVQVFYNCPFHSDSTPSFSVNQERNVFRCFGCQREGGPYKLIKEYLMFENQSSTPSNVVQFAEVDFQFPKFDRYNVAEIGKRDKFKAMLTPVSAVKKSVNKSAIIARIMLGISERDADVNMWEELFS